MDEISETKPDPIEEAKKLLQADFEKNQRNFLDAYKLLCLDYKMELSAIPQWHVIPLKEISEK